jgi:hypothetical protein
VRLLGEGATWVPALKISSPTVVELQPGSKVPEMVIFASSNWGDPLLKRDKEFIVMLKPEQVVQVV